MEIAEGLTTEEPQIAEKTPHHRGNRDSRENTSPQRNQR
jgi:hypothetical protein